jgi:hypothetical protein
MSAASRRVERRLAWSRMTKLNRDTFPQPYAMAPRKWRCKLTAVKTYMLRLRLAPHETAEPKPRVERLRRIPPPPSPRRASDRRPVRLGALVKLFEARAIKARDTTRARTATEIAQRFLTRAQAYTEAAEETRLLERQLRNGEPTITADRAQ